MGLCPTPILTILEVFSLKALWQVSGPPRWTQGYNATADPGRPRHSEAQHMHMHLPCTHLRTHARTHTHTHTQTHFAMHSTKRCWLSEKSSSVGHQTRQTDHDPTPIGALLHYRERRRGCPDPMRWSVHRHRQYTDTASGVPDPARGLQQRMTRWQLQSPCGFGVRLGALTSLPPALLQPPEECGTLCFDLQISDGRKHTVG